MYSLKFYLACNEMILLRPDSVALRVGDLDTAQREKHKLEALQRADKAARKAARELSESATAAADKNVHTKTD